jgi:Putative zinc-finger
MTEQRTNDNTDTAHADLERLIPWYVNGTLTPEETAAVAQHLVACELCRQEELRCQALVGQIPAPVEIWQPSPAHFAGILAEVDKLEATSMKPAAMKAKASSGLLERITGWFAQTPNPLRWALALETFAVAVLALVIVLPQSPNVGSGNVYETLSNSEAPAQLRASPIRLVFADDMTTQELSILLKQAKAQIQSGPSVVGSYMVEVPVAGKEYALGILRTHPKVRLAQPVE